MPSVSRLRQAGDTIVEVLISLAVLGLAIGISYATANRSLLNARQAQESAEATVLAQSQIEILRVWSGNPSTDINHSIYNNFVYCIAGGKVSTGNACVNGFYTTKITYNNANDTFTVNITWDDVLGDGTDSATLIYRVHA